MGWNPDEGKMDMKSEFLSKIEKKCQEESKGIFEQSKKQLVDIFICGEVVILKNAYFKIVEIGESHMKLRPMKLVDA